LAGRVLFSTCAGGGGGGGCGSGGGGTINISRRCRGALFVLHRAQRSRPCRGPR